MGPHEIEILDEIIEEMRRKHEERMMIRNDGMKYDEVGPLMEKE